VDATIKDELLEIKIFAVKRTAQND